MNQVRRRSLIAAAALLIVPWITHAQSAKRIGVLGPRKNSVILPPAINRLAELGYVEGKNLVIHRRSAEGVIGRFPALARELIEANCDLIFAVGALEAARAFVNAKASVPVVFLANDYDPVAAQIVPNLHRPGGNITGVVLATNETSAKRLEIMREIIPTAKRMLVLSDAFTADQLKAVQHSAKALRVEVVPEIFTARPYGLDAAFRKARSARIEAVIVLSSPVLFDQRKELAQVAVRHRLPTAVSARVWGEDGFVFMYGPDFTKAFARAGDIAASILRGAKPGEMPIEQPTNFEFTLNLKVAHALGLEIPPTVRVRADRIIE